MNVNIAGIMTYGLKEYFKSNILLYSVYYGTQKRATTWRGPSPRHCYLETQLFLKKCRNGGKPLAILFPILPAQRFKLETSRTRDESVTVRPT